MEREKERNDGEAPRDLHSAEDHPSPPRGSGAEAPGVDAATAARSAGLKRMGLLLVQFPGQTSISWWRVGQAMKEHGVEVHLISTRPGAPSERVHSTLDAEARRTHYVWPPRPGAVLRSVVRTPLGWWRVLRYITGLTESSLPQRLKRLPLALCAADLAEYARQQQLQCILIHSCAEAAHVGAMARLLGGCDYALRLGGDLEVYGKDHPSKMGHAALIVSSASPYIDRLVNEIGVPRRRIMWTMVGVDTHRFTPAEDHDADPSQPPHIVTVARLNYAKGFDYALDALARLRDRGIPLRYSIAGSGPYEPQIRQKIRQLDLEDHVHLLGALDEREIIELYRSADLTMLCSFNKGESSPAVVSESMACGVPAVCTVIGSTPEMIDDGVDGLLVPQEDSDAIAEAVAELISSPQRRRRMGEAARRRAVREFDTRVVAGNILEKLAETVGTAPPQE